MAIGKKLIYDEKFESLLKINHSIMNIAFDMLNVKFALVIKGLQ